MIKNCLDIPTPQGILEGKKYIRISDGLQEAIPYFGQLPDNQGAIV